MDCQRSLGALTRALALAVTYHGSLWPSVFSTFPTLQSYSEYRCNTAFCGLLAVEEHFYLLWPAAVRSLPRRWVAIVGAVICILCPSLRAFYFVRGYNAGTGYTWLVADGLATGECWPCWLVADGEHEVVCGSVTLICFAASMTMFIVGYPFGIFHANRFLGFTLRETALNLFFAGWLH